MKLIRTPLGSGETAHALTEGGLGRRPNTSGCQGAGRRGGRGVGDLKNPGKQASRTLGEGISDPSWLRGETNFDRIASGGYETGGPRGGIGPLLHVEPANGDGAKAPNQLVSP